MPSAISVALIADGIAQETGVVVAPPFFRVLAVQALLVNLGGQPRCYK